MKTNNNAVLDNFPQYTLSDVGSAVYSPASAEIDAPSSQERSGVHRKCPIRGTYDQPWAEAEHFARGVESPEGTTLNVGTGKPRGASIKFNFLRKLSSSSGLKSRETGNTLRFSSYSGVSWRSLLLGRVATYWAELMRRTLAPLRRIVSRELEVYAYGRISAHPQSFVVHDRMECGHVHTSLLWDIFDLLNAYTESPHVRAIRHRCDECKELMQRKPMASVAAIAKAA